MKIAMGADHAGYQLKKVIIAKLSAEGHEVKDYGCFSTESVDYPDFAHPVGKGVDEKQYDLGIVICGSGNGINMTVNKYQDVRSALCWKPEIATLARQHNNANILSLPARYIDETMAIECVDTFLNTEFEGGRHERRVEKIRCR